MSNVIVAALAGALALSACAPTGRMNVPPGYADAPKARLESQSNGSTGAALAEGYRMYQHADFRQAGLTFQRALSEHPADYEAAYLLGMSYLKRSRYGDARSAFRLALDLAPDRVTASRICCGIAYSYEATRQTRMAHHYYHWACKYYKPNAYAQKGASRTEYRKVKKPKPDPRYARQY